jgi:xanthine dehydrogenase accessory factor
MAEWIEPIRAAMSWRQKGQAVAIATVTKTWGSSPCPPSSRLAVNEEGNFVGSVSAGCVEGQVISAAKEVLRDGLPKALTFGVSDETVWSVGLACGGEISILVTPFIDMRIGSALIEAAASRATAILATDRESGDQAIRCRSESLGKAELFPYLADRSEIEADEKVFVERFLPRRRMILVGAVHIAQDIARIAKLAGFDVVVTDPRSAYATEDRFPGTSLCVEWPDEALQKLALDPQSCVITLTHDPKIDDVALLAAARSPAFYIAALGSQRTQRERIRRLTEMGLTPEEIARIKGPAGLDIGSLTPPEIAISIIAEAISIVRNDRRRPA